MMNFKGNGCSTNKKKRQQLNTLAVKQRCRTNYLIQTTAVITLFQASETCISAMVLIKSIG